MRRTTTSCRSSFPGWVRSTNVLLHEKSQSLAGSYVTVTRVPDISWGKGQEPDRQWWCLCSLSAPHPAFLALSARAEVCVSALLPARGNTCSVCSYHEKSLSVQVREGGKGSSKVEPLSRLIPVLSKGDREILLLYLAIPWCTGCLKTNGLNLASLK